MQEFRPPPKSPVRWPSQLTPKNGGRKGYTAFVALASSRRFAKAKPETASADFAAFAFLRLNHRRSNRLAVLVVLASQFARSSAIESPPYFSTAASARTNATIASPTTAAAGTAQTSLRSTVARLSVIVARSTDLSGFISVEIGFM